MGRKIDLDSENVSSNLSSHRTHPLSYDNYVPSEEEDIEEENYDNEEVEEETEEEEVLGEETVSDSDGKPLTDNSDTVNKIAKIGLKLAAKSSIIPWIILGIVLLFIFVFLIVIIVVIISSAANNQTASGYYDVRCKEVTVIMTDENYRKTGSKTYSLDDYLAGVVSAEVGMFNNLEVYKVFAIAARTYLLNNDYGRCTIESSDRKQVFRDVTASKNGSAALIYQAVRETASQVLLSGSGLYGVEYDAFCTIAVDSNYYTLKQQNQKIPRSWADSQSGISSAWKQGNCAGNHGRGISQWGSFYLVTQEEYTHTDVINYYLGSEGVAISKSGSLETVPGIVVRDTTDAEELHLPLSEVLSKNGSSISALNNYIRSSVRENGAGTRDGVVTAAVSLVNFLYDGFNVRIPYYWGGAYQQIGVNPNFGAKTTQATSRNGVSYNYLGFDCSGFVSWALKNGGYNIGRQSTNTLDTNFSGDSCNITNKSCVGAPGDLINSASCHVQLIVGVDESRGIYYVAESTGEYGAIVREWDMHKGNCGRKTTKILHMTSYYSNEANTNKSY